MNYRTILGLILLILSIIQTYMMIFINFDISGNQSALWFIITLVEFVSSLLILEVIEYR